MTITWLIFETLGTIAFAFSGTVVGLSRRMDIFGITVLAVMTGVGTSQSQRALRFHYHGTHHFFSLPGLSRIEGE